jgi:hypothetical protein
MPKGCRQKRFAIVETANGAVRSKMRIKAIPRVCVRVCRKSGSELCEAILSKAELKADVRATLLSYKAVMFNCARDDRVLKT